MLGVEDSLDPMLMGDLMPQMDNRILVEQKVSNSADSAGPTVDKKISYDN